MKSKHWIALAAILLLVGGLASVGWHHHRTQPRWLTAPGLVKANHGKAVVHVYEVRPYLAIKEMRPWLKRWRRYDYEPSLPSIMPANWQWHEGYFVHIDEDGTAWIYNGKDRSLVVDFQRFSPDQQYTFETYPGKLPQEVMRAANSRSM
ncbi:MAG: hypothetical protein AAF226_12190 [Verrucomicrobiota bacterium]